MTPFLISIIVVLLLVVRSANRSARAANKRSAASAVSRAELGAAVAQALGTYRGTEELGFEVSAVVGTLDTMAARVLRLKKEQTDLTARIETDAELMRTAKKDYADLLVFLEGNTPETYSLHVQEAVTPFLARLALAEDKLEKAEAALAVHREDQKAFAVLVKWAANRRAAGHPLPPHIAKLVRRINPKAK